MIYSKITDNVGCVCVCVVHLKKKAWAVRYYIQLCFMYGMYSYIVYFRKSFFFLFILKLKDWQGKWSTICVAVLLILIQIRGTSTINLLAKVNIINDKNEQKESFKTFYHVT